MQAAFLAFGQCGAVDLRLLAPSGQVLYAQPALAAHLDAVMEAGVVARPGSSLQSWRLDSQPPAVGCRVAGPVFDRGFNVIGVADRGLRSIEPEEQDTAENNDPVTFITRVPVFSWIGISSRGARPLRTDSSALQPLQKLRQTLEDGDGAQPDAIIESRRAGDLLARRVHRAETADCAVSITPSPRVQWSGHTYLPGEDYIAANRRRASQPRLRAKQRIFAHARAVATWTKLSILEPSPISVTPIVARSTQALACTSTRLPNLTGPDCGIFSHPPARLWRSRIHPRR